MKRGTPEHPKTRMLAEKLAAPKYAACGILELLWHLTARYAPRGDIGRFSDAMIADHLDWKGKPDQLVAALVDSGWLERDKIHRLIVHDWKDHCEQTVIKWVKRNKVEFVQKSMDIHVLPCPDKKEGMDRNGYPFLSTEKDKEGADIHIQPCLSTETAQNDTKKGMDRNGYPFPEINILPKPMPMPMPRPCVDIHAGAAEGEAGEETDQTTPLREAASAGQAPDTESGKNPAADPGPGEGSVPDDITRAIEGDEAHKVLKERPELRNLRYEQDLAARKDWACFEPKPDWVEIAHWVSVKAVLAGHVNEPGSWLLAQYRKWFDDFQKKNGGNSGRSANPLVRLFRRER
jgi:hypothetical protein